MRYDLSADEAYEMSINKKFQEKKCRDANAVSWRVTVNGGESGAIVRTYRKLPTVGFPSLLRKVLPSGVAATETIVWSAAAADGARTAQLSVNFHGSPASLNGTIRIFADGPTASTVVVDAEFKVRVPLFGGRVENAAAPVVVSVIDAEEATARAWAAGVR